MKKKTMKKKEMIELGFQSQEEERRVDILQTEPLMMLDASVHMIYFW